MSLPADIYVDTTPGPTMSKQTNQSVQHSVSGSVRSASGQHDRRKHSEVTTYINTGAMDILTDEKRNAEFNLSYVHTDSEVDGPSH